MVKVSLMVHEVSLEQLIAGQLMKEYDFLEKDTTELGYADRLERMALMSSLEKVIAHFTTEYDYEQWAQGAA